MIVKKFEHPWLGHRSFLIADPVTGTAIVIDPFRDVDPYLEFAWTRGLTVRHVFLTKLHNDFEAGHLGLRDRSESMVYLGAWARPEYSFTPVKNGDVLEFGDLRLEVLETPGHTLESICLVAYDLAYSSGSPRCIFTGDTMAVGDVGRPDPFSTSGTSAAELAGMLFDSLRERLRTLPPTIHVYSGRSAEASCPGNSLPEDVSTTLGHQKKCNFAMRSRTRSQFTRLLTGDLPQGPRYLSMPPFMNRYERPRRLRSPVIGLRPCGVDRPIRGARRGLQLVDVRDPSDHGAAHPKGSLNLPLGPRFGSWVSDLLDPDRAVLIVADPGREEEARVFLGEAGITKFAGYLEGGMEAFEGHPELVEATPMVTAPSVQGMRERGSLFLLDVGDGGRRLPGAVHIPLAQLPRRRKELPSRQIVVVSETGYAASAAASFLRAKGTPSVSWLVGGRQAWELLT